MGMIKGITIGLKVKTLKGVDEFNRNVYEESYVDVENVLVAPSTSSDIVNNTDLSGKKAVYTLAIPKGDTHVWENTEVTFWGKTWRTVGFPIRGIEENVPLDWNTKVTVECCG